MKCPSEKHEITIWLNCETFARLQEAAQYTGCGNDLERYITRLILEHS